MTRTRLALSVLTVFVLAACNDDGALPIDESAASRGKVLAEDCTACHSITNRENLIGPSLVGLYGRDVASVSGFEYSEALEALDFEWDSDHIAEFLLDPTGVYPGTMMAYSGLTEQNAADISEYFRSLSK